MDNQTLHKMKKVKKEQVSACQHPASEGYFGDEIDLFDIVMVIWRQKWFCATLISAFVLLAILYVVVATPLYVITCQVRPGITRYDDRGNPVRTLTPVDIKTYFGKRQNWFGVLDTLGQAEKLNVASTIKRGSSIVDVSLYWPNPDSGVKLLRRFLEYVGGDSFEKINKEIQLFRKQVEQAIDKVSQEKKHIDIERKRLAHKIKKANRKLLILNTELRTLKENKKLTSELINKLEKQYLDVNKNAIALLHYRNTIHKAKSKDVLSFLVYLNIVQQNISYITRLENRIADLEKELNQYDVSVIAKENEIDNVKMNIADLEVQRDKELPMKKKALENRIVTLKAKLDAIRPIEVLTPPRSSRKPVKPKKKVIFTLATFAGFFVAIFLAFVKDFWERNKQR